MPQTFYRGESSWLRADTLLEVLEPGVVFKEVGFWSSSRSLAFAEHIAGRGLVWVLHATIGSSAADIHLDAPFSNEMEVLWNRGTEFRVLKVDVAERIIEVEAIP